MKRSKTQILNPRDTVLIAALTLFLSACISDGSPFRWQSFAAIGGEGDPHNHRRKRHECGKIARDRFTIRPLPCDTATRPNRNRFAMALTSERLVKRGIPGTPAVFETMYRE